MIKTKTTAVALLLVLLAVTAAHAEGPRGQVNVNSAQCSELWMIPYITKESARSIIAYRKANGPFRTIDDLLKVPGIDKKTFDKVKPYLKLDGVSELNKIHNL